MDLTRFVKIEMELQYALASLLLLVNLQIATLSALQILNVPPIKPVLNINVRIHVLAFAD